MVKVKTSLIHYEFSQLEAGMVAQQLIQLPALVEDEELSSRHSQLHGSQAQLTLASRVPMSSSRLHGFTRT